MRENGGTKRWERVREMDGERSARKERRKRETHGKDGKDYAVKPSQW